MERFRKLRIREDSVDDVILPFKLARLSTEPSAFDDIRLELQELEQVGSVADNGSATSSSLLPDLSGVLGIGTETKSSVDRMIEALIRRDYLRQKFQALRHAHGEHSAMADGHAEGLCQTEDEVCLVAIPHTLHAVIVCADRVGRCFVVLSPAENG